MSWFDTAGFVSVAKSALKGAQKTIDKALDIKEDEDSNRGVSSPTAASTEKSDSDNFFTAWGVKGNASPDKSATLSTGPQDSFSSSLWGSFTGSFFENPRHAGNSEEETFSSPISEQPKRSNVSKLSGGDIENDLDQDLGLSDERSMWEGFTKTQLVVEAPITSKEDKLSLSSPAPAASDEVKWRRKEKQNERSQNRNSYPNRLSVISSESDKRSSDSVEVLGSTSCTASPDSDLPTSFSASSLASSAGLRPVSASSPDSVEVIPESSESHSVSVEVLGSRSSSTSLSSPTEPPLDRPPFHSPKDLASPESVEVLPEEEEDGSLADDSYASASASESTMTQATVLEPHGQLCSAMDSSAHFVEAIDSSGQVEIVTSSTSGRTDSSFSSLVLDSSTDTIHSDHSVLSRSSLPVSSEHQQTSKSWLLPSQPLTEKHCLENIPNKLLASPKKSLSKSRESLNRSSEKKDVKVPAPDSPSEDCQGTTTVSLTDSSGEGTLMESSSDDPLPVSTQQSTSGYVKNLLADAIGDDTSQVRVNSPVSLESRSEMGHRLGSEQTSGHTSGDELETTTSSDIEIISSPNGDGSSTTSRHSPTKLVHRGQHGHVDILKYPGKMKGHQREPSEASSGGSDDSHGSEMDRLLKRLSEVSELLEARETKLLALSRSHAELQERHQDLHSQLESAQQSRLSESRNLNEASEEFTRRLSALERKFQQAIRDKDILQKQLEQNKSERAHELSERIGERDETIGELRTEGEKLSRQLLQQSNLIKKLRSKEKENDNTIKSLREQVEALTGEIERLKRSLAAKEEVERSQIEAVHQLTARVKKLENELATVRDQKDDLHRKTEEAQTALDNSLKELSAAREREQGAEEGARAELEAALNAAQQHKRQLMLQMDKMREQLAQAEATHTQRESELLGRLEGAELRGEQLGQQLSEATRPLLRQLQALQASCRSQQDAWERQERALSEALGEAQAQVARMSEAERTSREELLILRSKVSTLENKLSAASQLSLSSQGQSLQLQSELERLKETHEESKKLYEVQLNDLQRQVTSLDHQLSVERAATEAEKRRSNHLQEQLSDRHGDRSREKEGDGAKRESPLVAVSGHSSPTISFGRDSLSESISSMAWPVFTDDAFETVSSSGRNVYESVRQSHTTSILEGLQSQLKLREGEVQQLQWELSRRESQRCALTGELSALAARVEDQEARLVSTTREQEALTSQLSTLRTEYDALLQMYGEKLEECQELRLDLQDVKDMYKAQIDQLLEKEEHAQIRMQHESSDDHQNPG